MSTDTLHEIRVGVFQDEDGLAKVRCAAPADPLLTLRMLNDAIGLTLDRIQKAKTPEEPKPAPKLTIVRPRCASS